MNTNNKKQEVETFRALNCLKPNNDPLYTPPTAKDIKSLIAIAGWSQNEIAKLCGVSSNQKKGSSTVRKWCSESDTENRSIPYTAWRLLLLKANFISLDDEDNITMNKPINSKSELLSIKGREDITRYWLIYNETGAIASPFQKITHEYRLNAKAVVSFEFFDEVNYTYVMKEMIEEFGHCIAMAIGQGHEVLCFKKSAAGEYHRLKRQIEEIFNK